MSIYNVYLVTPYRHLPFPIDYSPIRETLEKWFLRVVKKSPNLGYQQARVQYASATPPLAKSEVLAYLLPSRSQSLWIYQAVARWKQLGKSPQEIQRLTDHEQGNLSAYGGGYTNQIGNEMLSEIWLDECPKNFKALASAIFHELMHNTSNNTMPHGLYGDLSRSPPWFVLDDRSVESDMIAMSNWMIGAPAQWTGGVALYRQNNP
jgi:hypothetical protein